MTWRDTTFIAMKVLRKGPLVLLVTADWRQDKALGSEENGSWKVGCWNLKQIKQAEHVVSYEFCIWRDALLQNWGEAWWGEGAWVGWMGNVQWNVEFGYQLGIHCRTERNHGKTAEYFNRFGQSQDLLYAYWLPARNTEFKYAKPKGSPYVCSSINITRQAINIIIIIIINIKDWTLWSIPSPELQLPAPTLLRSSNCSPSLWSVVVWFQRDSVLWHSLQV